MMTAASFAALFAALFVAHQVADHSHVATYTATAALFVLPVVTVLGVHATVWRLATGLGISALTHWIIDRRWTLVWLAERTGSRTFVRMGTCRPGRDDNACLGTGAYALDQSAHYVFLFVAALVAVA